MSTTVNHQETDHANEAQSNHKPNYESLGAILPDLKSSQEPMCAEPTVSNADTRSSNDADFWNNDLSCDDCPRVLCTITEQGLYTKYAKCSGTLSSTERFFCYVWFVRRRWKRSMVTTTAKAYVYRLPLQTMIILHVWPMLHENSSTQPTKFLIFSLRFCYVWMLPHPRKVPKKWQERKLIFVCRRWRRQYFWTYGQCCTRSHWNKRPSEWRSQ